MMICGVFVEILFDFFSVLFCFEKKNKNNDDEDELYSFFFLNYEIGYHIESLWIFIDLFLFCKRREKRSRALIFAVFVMKKFNLN
jgi:hypothetical protein